MSEPKHKVPRIELQKAMAPEVEAAIAKVEKQFNLDPADPDAQRRFFRALVTVAAQRLFDMGAPPPFIAQQAFEAVAHEAQYRHQQKTLHMGQPFGPLPTGKA